MLKLQIFVSDGCWSCEESERIAAETEARFAEVEVALVDLHNEERPSYVFAAPTYVLNGRIIYLGNPRREALWQQLAKYCEFVRSDEDEVQIEKGETSSGKDQLSVVD